MVQISKKNLKKLLWVLLLLNMAAVFALSAQPADISTDETDLVIALPKYAFDTAHPELADDEAYVKLFRFVVRKTAHFMEFATLSVWAAWLMVLYGWRHPFLFGGLFSMLYAAGDELHQIYVPGREGKITDWGIDSAGAILGAILIWWLLMRKKRQKMDA